MSEEQQVKTIKYDTLGNLENSKRAFFTDKTVDVLREELLSKPYKLYHLKYIYSNDMDGYFDFAARNFVNGGLIKSCEPYKKYIFGVFRCYVLDRVEKKYNYEAYFICNTTAHIKDILTDCYDNFTWDCITDIDEFITHFNFNNDDNLLCEAYLH